MLPQVLRNGRRSGLAGPTLAVGLAAGLAVWGCTNSSLYLNLTARRSGNVTFQFVNTTPYRALFTYGGYDDLNRAPGPVVLEQLRLEANTTSEATEVFCVRNLAVGTDGFINRAIETGAHNDPGFDAEAFSTQIGFSSFPAGSEGEGLADVGTAEGVGLLLGVDYTCGDRLIFTLSEDATAPGGFRVDFDLVMDEE